MAMVTYYELKICPESPRRPVEGSTLGGHSTQTRHTSLMSQAGGKTTVHRVVIYFQRLDRDREHTGPRNDMGTQRNVPPANFSWSAPTPGGLPHCRPFDCGLWALYPAPSTSPGAHCKSTKLVGTVLLTRASVPMPSPRG